MASRWQNNGSEPDWPIRIAYCVDDMQVSAAGLNAVRKAERLERYRFSVCVVRLGEDGPLTGRYRDAGIEVIPLSIKGCNGGDPSPPSVRLRRLLKERRIHILHAHDNRSTVFGVPVARAAGIRAIASRRWWDDTRGPLWEAAFRTACQLADVTVTNSKRLAARIARTLPLPRSRVVVVRDFVNAAAFVPPPLEERRRLETLLGLREDQPTIGVVADLERCKGQAMLIRATALLKAEFPTLRTVFIGSGPCRFELERLVGELGLQDQVRFAGRLPNVPNPHHLLDISVLTSLNEGLPETLLDAMAASRPVVATDVGGVADAVVPGVTGLLVPPAEPAALAAALRELVLRPKQRGRMGSNGLRRLRSVFSPSAGLSALEEIYCRLGNGSPGSVRGETAAALPPDRREKAACGD